MIYIYIFNRSWVDTRWQQYITHLHTNSTHNTQSIKYQMDKKSLNAEKFKDAKINGQLLTQPLWKLVEAATQVLCKCLDAQKCMYFKQWGYIIIYVHIIRFFLLEVCTVWVCPVYCHHSCQLLQWTRYHLTFFHLFVLQTLCTRISTSKYKHDTLFLWEAN
jgi:hypothetical protein